VSAKGFQLEFKISVPQGVGTVAEVRVADTIGLGLGEKLSSCQVVSVMDGVGQRE